MFLGFMSLAQRCGRATFNNLSALPIDLPIHAHICNVSDLSAMTLAPWRSPLARALHRSRRRPESRYFQLATVDRQGFPDNRTVVFRGFLEADNQIKIITDQRSHKIQQLQQNPHATICWYFGKSREQFRLWGTIQMITSTTNEPWSVVRQATWQNLSENAQTQFGWPEPASPRQNSATPLPVHTLDPDCPPATFTLLIFTPHQVDHLELRGNPQNRTCYQLSPAQQWEVHAVHP